MAPPVSVMGVGQKVIPAGGPAVAGAAGGWALGFQPSAAPASAGWGSGAPPRPQPSVFVPFDLTLVSTGAGLPDFVLYFAFLRFFAFLRLVPFVLHFAFFCIPEFFVIAYPILFLALCLSLRDVFCLFPVLCDLFFS